MTATRGAAGYTLVEVLMVTAVMAIVAAMAVPAIAAGMRRYALNNAAQQVASTIRSARYTAVAKNSVVRVRFNCPATGQYRMVEFTGMSAIDQADDRCSATAYPYPDEDPGAVPHVDGPVLVLPPGTELGAVTDIEISTQGRMSALTGCPVCTASGSTPSIALENGYESQTITMSQTGQIAIGAAVDLD